MYCTVYEIDLFHKADVIMAGRMEEEHYFRPTPMGIQYGQREGRRQEAQTNICMHAQTHTERDICAQHLQHSTF